MNIIKFLLVDLVLVVVITPLLFLLQGGNKKSRLLRRSNKEKLLRKNSIKIPNKEKLIELEELAKNQGSGIKFDSIMGDWKFVSVWKKNIDEEDPFFSSLLRVFSARINFKKDISTDNSPEFSVMVSIEFGLFTIEFSGCGYLKGKQPLLAFFLNIIEVKLGSNVLLSRSLKEPEEKDNSYFSMIALEKKGAWLSARGQGGSLVIWLKD